MAQEEEANGKGRKAHHERVTQDENSQRIREACRYIAVHFRKNCSNTCKSLDGSASRCYR